MDEGVSGFRVRGTWQEIVEHGQRITSALRELLPARDPLSRMPYQEWEDWRPKIGDSLEGEVARRTSQQAAIDEGRGEARGKAPGDDIRSAGRELKRTVGDDGAPAKGHLRSAWRYTVRAADSAARRLVRGLERTVYEKIMTRVSPYYFDNELISANLSRDRNGDGATEEQFVFEINVHDDDLKERVSDRLAERNEASRDAEQETGSPTPKVRSRD